MTPNEYRAAIDKLGLSQVKAGRLLGVNQRTSRVWAKDGAPPSVAVALAAMVIMKDLGLDPLAMPAIRRPGDDKALDDARAALEKAKLMKKAPVA